MDKHLCALICFLVGILLFYLLKSYCSCSVTEGFSGGDTVEGFCCAQECPSNYYGDPNTGKANPTCQECQPLCDETTTWGESASCTSKHNRDCYPDLCGTDASTCHQDTENEGGPVNSCKRDEQSDGKAKCGCNALNQAKPTHWKGDNCMSCEDWDATCSAMAGGAGAKDKDTKCSGCECKPDYTWDWTADGGKGLCVANKVSCNPKSGGGWECIANAGCDDTKEECWDSIGTCEAKCGKCQANYKWTKAPEGAEPDKVCV